MSEEYVSRHLQSLARRPTMYAHTNEAFVAIVETLLHTLRVRGPALGYTLMREGSCGDDTTKQVTCEFARWVIDLARKRIELAPRCPLCNRLAGDATVCSHGIHCCDSCEWKEGERVRACWAHNEEPVPVPSEDSEELAAGIETVIEFEVTEVSKFKPGRLAAMFANLSHAKNAEERKLAIRASIRESCRNRYEGGICKLCGGSALPCVTKHAKGESCASPPRVVL